LWRGRWWTSQSTRAAVAVAGSALVTSGLRGRVRRACRRGRTARRDDAGRRLRDGPAEADDAARLEEEEQRDRDAEDDLARLLRREAAADPLGREQWQPRPPLDDELRQEGHEQCAGDRSDRRAEAADHDHREEVHGEEEAEVVRDRVPERERGQHPAEAADRTGDDEHTLLVVLDVDPERGRGDLAVPERLERASRPRPEEVRDVPPREHEEEER